MAEYTVTINDPILIDGIIWAREQFNHSLASNEKGAELKLDTDQQYIQWVVDQATTAYAKQQQLELIQQKVNTAHSAGLTELKALADSME